MYQTILVPLDGPKLAECVLPYVEALVRSSQAKVIFVHVEKPLHHPAGGKLAFPAKLAPEITSEHFCDLEGRLIRRNQTC